MRTADCRLKAEGQQPLLLGASPAELGRDGAADSRYEAQEASHLYQVQDLHPQEECWTGLLSPMTSAF